MWLYPLEPPCPLHPDGLDPEQASRIVHRFHTGEPKAKVAADFGMSVSSIKRLLRRHHQ
jgi:DNA-directed RNA polymerase specialized sigma24 family protein